MSTSEKPKTRKPALTVVETGLPHWLLPKRVSPVHPMTDAEVEYIFEKMCEGQTVAAIVRDHGGLDYGKVIRTLTTDPELKKRYYSLRETRGEINRERLELAAEGYDKDGMPEDVARSSLKVHTYKWLMQVDNRKMYGDSKNITFNGKLDIGSAMAKADQRVLGSGDVIEHED